MAFFQQQPQQQKLTPLQIQQMQLKRQARKKKLKKLQQRVTNQAENGLLSILKGELSTKLLMKKDTRQAYINGLIDAAPASHKKRLQCLQMALGLCKTDKQRAGVYSAIKNYWHDRKYYWYQEGNEEKQAEVAEKEKQAATTSKHYRDLYEQGDKESEKLPLLDQIYAGADKINAQINDGCTKCFANIKKCFGC
jgi:hypothetical protein